MALVLNGTTGISGVDGSTSAPPIKGTDSNTGLSFASDTIAFNTAGSERCRLDADGRLLIGTTTSSGTSSLSDDIIIGSIGDSTNRGLTFATSGVASIRWADAGDNAQGRIEYSNSTDNMTFHTDNATRMTIASDGNVGVGKSSTSLDLDGFIIFGDGQAVQAVKSGSGGKILTLNRRTNVGLSVEFFRGSGSSVGSISHNNTSTAFNTTSDYRLKENVVTLSDAITRLKTLKPYRFNFKADKDVTVDGFLAHEVTAVPEAIQGEKDAVITQAMVDNEGYEKERLGEILPQGIDQAKLVPLLTAALQEAVGKIETLETKVAALEAA